MPYTYTTDELVDDVQLITLNPNSQTNFTPLQILSLGDKELYRTVTPLFLSLNRNFYLESVDIPILTGVQEYTLPRYMMYGKLRRIDVIGPGNYIYELVNIEPDELANRNYNINGLPDGFMIRGETIFFYPVPNNSLYTARLWIYRRPGRMVPTSMAAKVQSVNYATGAVTYTAVPPATYTATSTHDFYSFTPPFVRKQNNITATAIAANVQTFPVASVATLLPGDWVNVVDETVFPPLPLEIQPLIRDLIVLELNRSQMDVEQYSVVREDIAANIKSVLGAGPGDRVQGNVRKLSLANNRMLTNRGRGWWRNA